MAKTAAQYSPVSLDLSSLPAKYAAITVKTPKNAEKARNDKSDNEKIFVQR